MREKHYFRGMSKPEAVLAFLHVASGSTTRYFIVFFLCQFIFGYSIGYLTLVKMSLIAAIVDPLARLVLQSIIKILE